MKFEYKCVSNKPNTSLIVFVKNLIFVKKNNMLIDIILKYFYNINA
jgi:hypothetical protein